MSFRDREHWYLSHESERDYAGKNPYLIWTNSHARVPEEDSGDVDFIHPISGVTHDVKRVKPGNGPRLGMSYALTAPDSPDWIVLYDGSGNLVGKISQKARLAVRDKNGHIPNFEIVYAEKEDMDG